MYVCSGNQVPFWVDSSMKTFKCTLPERLEDLEDSDDSTDSAADLIGLDEVYEAIYYEILDA